MEQRSWLRGVLVGVLSIVILLGGSVYYLNRVQRSLWELSVSNMLEVTVQGGHTFESYVEQGLSMLDGRANNFAQYSSQDKDAIGAKLELYEDGDPSFTVIDLTHGIIYFNSTQRTTLPQTQVESYLALPDRGFLEPYLSEYTGQRMVGYYERFRFSDGAEGMVRKSVRSNEIGERFSLTFYDGAGFSYVVNRKGDIMLRSASENGNRTFLNVFDVIALDDNTEEETALFRSALADGKRGVMRLRYDGQEHTFAFVPLTAADGWYLISIVPNDVIMKHANDLMMTSQIFLVILAVVVLIFLSFFLVMSLYRRRIQAKQVEVLYREQMFNLLASDTNDVFLMLASDISTVEYISPNVERVFGIPREAVVQDLSVLQSVIHGDGQEFDLAVIADTPLGETISFEGRFIQRSTGDRRWFVETVYHTVVESLERYILVLADRTEERRKEDALTEALQIAKVANEAKSTFLSNMSHDIRTPMNAIVGLSTLLQRDAEDPDKVREHTQKIAASSQHLLGLINDVLDMSKIESGKTALNVGEFSLAKLVEELDTMIRPQAKAKQQVFDISVRDIHAEMLVGDKLRISQVMMNILSNAVKYTPDGGHIVMTVQQLEQVAPEIVRTRFTVADNGIGMSEEFQKDIFQPFTREISSTVNQIQGTGLGMAITKNLVELMGGTISVQSATGEGSTFTIELDLRVQPQEEDGESFWRLHGISNVLVVDDDPDVCAEVLGAMAHTGVAMQSASGGGDALQMVQAAHRAGKGFDLILLDWKMPGMGGMETTRQIRATVPTHIPILLLTSYDWEELREEGAAAGIDGYLSKPFFLSNLKEVVRSLGVRGQETLPQTGAAGLNGRHFLCAEDNELNAEILVELLDMEGATAEVAVDGREALEKFSAAPDAYDAILMDVQMPVMNGYEATRAIRALTCPRAASIPIVAMTANAFADDVRNAMDAGMNAHIAKPVDMARLIQALDGLWRAQ